MSGDRESGEGGSRLREGIDIVAGGIGGAFSVPEVDFMSDPLIVSVDARPSFCPTTDEEETASRADFADFVAASCCSNTFAIVVSDDPDGCTTTNFWAS